MCYVMIGIDFSTIWFLSFPLLLAFNYLIFMFLMLIIPVLSHGRTITAYSHNTIATASIWNLFLFQMGLLILINLMWRGVPIIASFGHLYFANFHNHLIFITVPVFMVLLKILMGNFFILGRGTFDTYLTYWAFILTLELMFWSNSLMVWFFFIEFLTTLLFFLLINTIFSMTIFYASGPYGQGLLRGLLSIFWISFFISIFLFLFFVIGAMKLGTIDMFLTELMLDWFLNGSPQDYLILSFLWGFLFLNILIKCGLVPFHFWKILFFQKISFEILYIYIMFFFFFFLFFFFYLIGHTFSFLIPYLFIMNLVIISFGMISLVGLLGEYYSIRAFLTISSILNTFLLFTVLMVGVYEAV